MKTIQTLMTGLLFSSVLFSACTKEQYNVANGPTASQNSPTGTDRIKRPVNFNSGFISANYVKMTLDNNTVYESTDAQKIDLLNPLGQPNSQNIPAGQFDNLKITLKAFTNSGSPAVYLSGQLLRNNGVVVPISFMINSVVKIDASTMVPNITGNSSYLNLMNIDLTRLTNDITMDMWDVAAMNTQNISNGEIIISDKYNTDLYQIILRNLGSMVHVTFVPDADGGHTDSESNSQGI